MQNSDPYYTIYERYLKCIDCKKLKIKSWTKIYQANEDNKETGVVTLKTDKVDAKPLSLQKTKCVRKGHLIKEPHSTMKI